MRELFPCFATDCSDDRDSGNERGCQRIRILFADGRISLDSPCREIAERLVTEARVAVADLDHGYRLRKCQEPLLGPTVRPNAGLIAAVVHLLEEGGQEPIELVRGSPRPAPLPEPDLALTNQFGPYDLAMLKFVGSKESGLVRYKAGAVDPAWLMGQIALAFPDATLAVLVSSEAEGFRLRRRLSRWIPGVVMRKRRSPANLAIGQVVIGTSAGLADYAVEFGKRDIVVVPKATDVLLHYPQFALLAVNQRFRLFGMLPVESSLAPYDHDRLAAAFGFDEIFVPRHGFVQRSVRVVFRPIAGGPPLPLDLGPLELKRRGIWDHPVRTRRVARLAEAIAAGDITSIVAGEILSMQAMMSGATATANIDGLTPGKVVLLVETVEHAVALAERLRGWPVVTGENVVVQGLSSRQRRIIDERIGPPHGTGPVIVTAAGLRRVDLNTVGTVIWAGAGPGLPPVPVDRLVVPPDRCRDLILVDFADRHHPQLRRWSRQRQVAYVENDWLLPGVDPVQSRIEHFLATRPIPRRTP
ncbi:MAG: hypothetical protein GXY83_37965 [Rhodopirellula sp.]|nr:hypothetical protein [Rhodopirellula sp.]